MRFHYHLLNVRRVVVTQLETVKNKWEVGKKNQSISSSSLLDITLIIYWMRATYTIDGALPKGKRKSFLCADLQQEDNVAVLQYLFFDVFKQHCGLLNE